MSNYIGTLRLKNQDSVGFVILDILFLGFLLYNFSFWGFVYFALPFFRYAISLLHRRLYVIKFYEGFIKVRSVGYRPINCILNASDYYSFSYIFMRKRMLVFHGRKENYRIYTSFKKEELDVCLDLMAKTGFKKDFIQKHWYW